MRFASGEVSKVYAMLLTDVQVCSTIHYLFAGY